MRKFWLLLVMLTTLATGWGQKLSPSKVITRKMLATSIRNNPAGEDANRSISIYLPPGYSESSKRYPVVYFLHGYSSTDTEMMEWIKFQALIDRGIASGKLRPMIIVVPNSDTKYRGSFYTNSTLTGNWADFIGKDVVAWTDKNYRTIPDRKSRGICGHSMGGNGALKMAMLFPDVFGALYALSPAVLDWAEDFTLENESFKTISRLNAGKKYFATIDDLYDKWDRNAFFVGVLASMARSYSPDAKEVVFKADFPVSYMRDSMVIDSQVVKHWERNFPFRMIDERISALKSLTAIKIDWGRNEDFPHIPVTALRFSKKLETLGVEHAAEEYIGDHVNMIGGFDGRVATDMLPFFERYLKFE